MKKIIILIFLSLTACTSLASPTPTSFFDSSTPIISTDLTPAPVILTVPPNLTQPLSIAEEPPSSQKGAGELYFFLQPRIAGQSIQLVHVSGNCVVDAVMCPPIETIQVPFAFNFTINALSWSPDGRYAAFSYSDNSNGTPTKLWLLDPTTKTWTSLTQFPYIDPPFWSHDGSWIAFRAQDGVGGEDAYVIRPNGSELKSVGKSLPVEGRPYIMDGWYMDNIIMRSALPGNEGSIYLVNATSGQAHPMFDALSIKSLFVVSPNNGYLAYDEFDQNTQNHTLKVMDVNGTNESTLASFNGGRIYPIVWSPDGNLIAFNYYKDFSNSEPSAEVYVANRNNSNLSFVYKGETVGRLVFSPTGEYLLVEETNSPTGGHLFVINLAALEQKILQAPGLSTDYDWYAPSWKP